MEPVYGPTDFYYILYAGKNFANGFGRSVVMDLLDMGIVKYHRTVTSSNNKLAGDTIHYFVRADYDMELKE